MKKTSVRSEGDLRVSEYFGPLISVLATPEAESLLSQSNNLTPAELFQPFSTLREPLTLKDPEGAQLSLSELSLTFRDFKRDPHRSLGSKILSDHLASAENEEDAFKDFQNLFLASIPPAEHEYLRSEMGVLLMASMSEPEPLKALENLRVNTLEAHLRKKEGGYPIFASEEPWTAFLLLGEEEASSQYLSSLPSNHFYLRINSGKEKPSFHPWYSSLTDYKFCDIYSRPKGGSQVATTTNASLLVTPSGGSNSNNSDPPLDHPLARDPEEPPLQQAESARRKLLPASRENVALALGEEDFASIRKVVRELAIRGLVPFAERQMRILQEVASNRKSRSLLSGAKRWFGVGKPGASSGTSVVYGREAPEVQVRKLGDLYFMFKLYKHAYTCYHSIKKDFQSDEAWNYYAGAAEMSALSSFMMILSNSNEGKKYPSHYMEDAILKYQQVCQMPDFALRATLFDALCLRHLGMYEESAKSYIRMTTDAKDLRSSLLLEQAASCYLKCKPPLQRKYAFYIILAAYKYSKSGQKRHSSRAYEKGYEIYKGHSWSLSEDHILYNLGHLALLLKNHASAASLFNELFKMTIPVINPLQQMCHLREFFIVQHLREKEDKLVSEIPIPKFIPQELILDLNNDPSHRYESLIHSNPKTEWADLEKVIVERIGLGVGDPTALQKSCQSVYGPKSANNLIPQGTVEESIRYLIPLSNDFQTPLLLKQIYLLWRFLPDKDEEHGEGSEISNEDPQASKYIQTDTLESFSLEKSSKMVMALSLKPLRPGKLTILGIEYSLKALFSQSESTDYTIRGKQFFSIRGPRHTSIKDLKTSTHGPDHRLEVGIQSSQPKLVLSFTSGLPETLYLGEIRALEMELSNVGRVPLSQCLILSFLPGLLSFGGKKSNQLFEYPLTSDPNLFNSKESSPHGIPTPKVLDALPVPLGKGGALDPGKSLKLRIFIKSPQATGNHAIKLIFFYYEKAGGGHPRHRILCHQFNIKVLPCLSLSSQLLSPFLYNNSRDQVLSLFLTNGTTTSNKTQQQISLESVTLSQIGLISRDRSLSSSNAAASNNSNNNCLLVLSNNKWGEDIIVKRGESLKLVINTSNEEDSGEGLHFSELKSKSIQGSYSFHSPPYLDFLKSAFSFPKNEGPSLKNDVLAVVWRSGELSGLMLSEVKHEESSRAMEEEEEEGGGGAQNEDEGSSLISLDSSLTTLKPNFPLRVELKADPLSQADFEASPLFRAPFRISISNLANRNLYLHYQAPPQNILGCTSGSNVLLEAHSSKTFNLKAALTTPGLFHLRGGFMFQVTEGPLSDTTELEYVPMDISFIVKNKTSS